MLSLADHYKTTIDTEYKYCKAILNNERRVPPRDGTDHSTSEDFMYDIDLGTSAPPAQEAHSTSTVLTNFNSITREITREDERVVEVFLSEIWDVLMDMMDRLDSYSCCYTRNNACDATEDKDLIGLAFIPSYATCCHDKNAVDEDLIGLTFVPEDE